jgi:hypothetical protein
MNAKEDAKQRTPPVASNSYSSLIPHPFLSVTTVISERAPSRTGGPQ